MSFTSTATMHPLMVKTFKLVMYGKIIE